jgi:hypothetical protein
VVSSGGANRSDYNLTATTDLKGVTAIMLEVLPDPNAPLFGPGRAPDGNFILSELELKVGPADKAGQEKPASFAKAWASFEQDKFGVSNAIDGKDDDPANGWAIAGGKGIGMRNVAVFELERPLSDEAGAKLLIRLSQKARDNYLISRLRIYVTSAAEPLSEGATLAVAEAAAVPREKRAPQQVEALNAYTREADPEYWRLSRELSLAKKPLDPDPRHTTLKDALATASLPIRLDPALVQLRIDAEASKQQIANKRLTAVQDLTWALINNPAFLFNR